MLMDLVLTIVSKRDGDLSEEKNIDDKIVPDDNASTTVDSQD